MKQYICIDIGGTSIKYGVIQEDLTFLYTGEIPTEAQEHGGPGIVKKICKITDWMSFPIHLKNKILFSMEVML